MKEDDKVLERFMQEFFCFESLKKIGFFTEEMRYNYEAQADKICKFFGYETVYEYGSKSISCHITYSDSYDPTGISSVRPLYVDENGKLQEEPGITHFPSIYE